MKIFQGELKIMKMKKLLASALACTMLAGCSVGGTTSTSTAASSSSDDTAATDVDYSELKIGVTQYVKHAALDVATEGFVQALKDELGLTDDNFDILVGTTDSDATTNANTLVSEGVDLILANATPSLIAAANATTSIPILGTAITEYGVALGIDDFDGTVGGNISGTSDLAPLTQQAEMILELIPDAKNVGILYCSGEANSKYQVEVVSNALKDLGVNVTAYAFTGTEDVSSVTETACQENDVLYIPTDNTAASCTEAIDNVASKYNMPIIAGEEGIMEGCGIATLSISYYELGYTTGLMASRVLQGEDISTMPIEYYENPVKEYMADRCASLNITVPSDYTAYEAD